MENFKVIIVEDVPLELKGTEGLLRNEVPEAEVIGTASDETQFIQLMRTGNPDLILLDHEMPVTSGPQVLEMLRSDEETKDIPVIFLTGKSDKNSVMAVVALRPEGYFLKTVDREELLNKLKEFFILHK